MANKLNKKTPQKTDPARLKAEKSEKIKVKEVVKDERTHKIIGAFCMLIAVFLFIAFISYCFTWKQDQDKVFKFGAAIFSTEDVRVNNLLGVLGAYVSHNLIYYGFGIASFLICTFFFMLGVNLLFEKKLFSLSRNLRYLIIGLPVLSVAFAFFFKDAQFSYGGATGEFMEAWLVKWLGKVGTGSLLAVLFLSYIIWKFNPKFKLPEKKLKDFIPFPGNNSTEEEVEEKNNAALAKSEMDNSNSYNKLKNNDHKVVVIMPKIEENNDPSLEIIEKQEEDQNTVSLDLDNEDPLKVKEETVLNVEAKKSSKWENSDKLSLQINEGSNEAESDNVPDEKKVHLKDYEPTLDLSNYRYPSLDLLETHGSDKIVHDPAELESNKEQIISTLKNYDIHIQRISATIGPTVTLYEIVPAPGVRISRIKNLEDDIALSLAALGIRIIAPIPGKGTIGIEVPNVRKSIVSMKTLLASDKFQKNNFALPIAIGKKIDNENFIVDLASMPHLLMAGATGQGKSVGINTLLVSLLYKKHPSQLKLVLVDPKKVELSLYTVIEKHFLAKLPGEEESIITDTKKVVYTLNALCIEMDNRYDLLKEAGCRNIKEYNDKFIKRRLNPEKGHQYLPFIVLVIDEFADLIMTAGKEIEMPIGRLAQLARAVGIHLIIATQRPSVNIITGTIKANFPARIAFKVSSKIDSRTILDAGGSEQLIGKGDMLVSYNGEITRLQCAFVDTPEVERVCNFISEQQGYPEAFMLPEFLDEKEMDGKEVDLTDRDKLFEEAARLIVQSQSGSTSLIQRRMKLGYNRAGRLMDQLEAAGIVGPNLGSKVREVYVKTEMELEELLSTLI